MRALLPAGLLLLSFASPALADEPPARPAVAVYRGSESNVPSAVMVYRGSSDMGSPPAPGAAQQAAVLVLVVPEGAGYGDTYLWYPDDGFRNGRRGVPFDRPDFHGRFDTFPANAGT